jgi:hypothetical protein
MSTNKPSDAAIVNIKNTNKALVLSVDCNGRYVQADPEIGTMIAVCEAARNIVCSGGEPSAITNCLNFGNPYNPEVYWQFVGAIKGMSAACKKFETPVTGGNVSFYNQTVNEDGTAKPVFPTPTIGMVGVLQDKSLLTTLDFKYKGDLIYLLGETVEDRCGMLHTLVNLPQHPESVPINALVAVKGTPLENQQPVEIWEMVRMVATTRIVMPKTVVRLSAGRQQMSLEGQAMCFLAGANSIFTGEKLLTTPNPEFDEDMEMFRIFGLTPKTPFQEGRPLVKQEVISE